MNHASLAARYRPQSFADVTGQDMIKTILSRAAAEDRVAPAYLLSGTRGVGKTTIARIFAKALNCERAPTADPCNQCDSCRRIAQGGHVDVVEIDGASNRGIDDARRLREAIAYAPMEGRYKVFIIDEAHMLTRESFNALLKTLEEPPPRATFILATTEVHKFPATIVSRCQHFAFRAIPEAELAAHLSRVLDKEGVPFEEAAVRLVARRAAGSVRDGMSLLGQTLALGGDCLTEKATRDVLGLAGQELYERLLAALHAGDCLDVAALTRELLDRGVDLGFFLRELALLWRNLFLIRQAGAPAGDMLDLPEAERRRLVEQAGKFDLAYIHAAWQMTLESQRQILTSIEPAAALELLLLNLAVLPRLVSLETLSRAGGIGSAGRGGQNAAEPTVQPRPIRPAVEQGCAETGMAPPAASPEGAGAPRSARAMHARDAIGNAPRAAAVRQTTPTAPEGSSKGAPQTAQSPQTDLARHGLPPGAPARTVPPAAQHAAANDDAPGEPEPPDREEDAAWKAFLAYCAAHPDSALPLPALEQAKGRFSQGALSLAAISGFQHDQLAAPAAAAALRRLAAAFRGSEVDVRLFAPRPRKMEAELKKELANHPIVRALEDMFDASLLRCIPEDPPRQTTLSRPGREGANSKKNTKTTQEGVPHAQHE